MNVLARSLAARIRRDGPLAYSAFVEAALYDPVHGFYETGGAAGRRGDFLTSPEVGPLFGAVLARALDTWWFDLGCPEEYTVVECGAGPGTLARAVLAVRRGLACAGALRYVTVERSAAQRLRHPDGVDARAAFDLAPFTGVVLANELLDNLAFDLVERRAGAWHEVLVDVAPRATADDDADNADVVFLETLAALDGSSTLPHIARDGARLARQAAAQAFVADALGRLEHGQVVVIDYMSDTAGFVDREWREWVRTYRGHERGTHPLLDPGTQDITCEVDLDALVTAVPPFEVVTQAVFLAAHGIDALVEEGRVAWQAGAGIGDLAALRGRSRVREAEALCAADGLGGFTVARWVR
jgi:SAM-dependent MidA family methyltransferase